MPSTNKVHNAHMSPDMRTLHAALLEIVGVMNRPQADEAMIREAGIKLDRALFPLVVLIERLGPIGVVELAQRVGRDYTTVSRQAAKLETLGLIHRQRGSKDKRVREATIAPPGKAMTDRIDGARAKILARLFGDWQADEITSFVRLSSRFAGQLGNFMTEPD